MNTMTKKDEPALSLDEIEQLSEIKDNFLFFLENTSDYIYFKDRNHRFTYASDMLAKLTDHDNWQQLIGKTDFDIFPLEHAKVYFEKEETVITGGQDLLSIEEPYFNLDGNLCWVSSSKRPIKDSKDNIVGLFGISRDITKVKELETELSIQAHFDPLTTLPNRIYFLEQVEKLLSLAQRNNQTLAFFYIDLDGFKQINDKFGHEAGDTVLTTLSKRFKERLRESDIIGRLGGDEFAMVSFTHCDKESLIQLSSVFVELTHQAIPYHTHQLVLGCSVGIACFPKDADTIHDLMIKSDQAMYVAKQQGKSNSVIFDG